MASLLEVAIEHDVAAVVCGAPSTVHVRIQNNYKASLDFGLHGSTYTFNITRWMGGGMSNFLTMFHAHAVRDPVRFGTVVIGGDGTPTLNVDMTQKLAAVQQACSDILACLTKLTDIHKRAILDYAVWYREKHKEETTYSEFITLLTCHNIVHSDFMAPDARWEVVQF